MLYTGTARVHLFIMSVDVYIKVTFMHNESATSCTLDRQRRYI